MVSTRLAQNAFALMSRNYPTTALFAAHHPYGLNMAYFELIRANSLKI